MPMPRPVQAQQHASCERNTLSERFFFQFSFCLTSKNTKLSFEFAEVSLLSMVKYFFVVNSLRDVFIYVCHRTVHCQMDTNKGHNLFCFREMSADGLLLLLIFVTTPLWLLIYTIFHAN